MSYFLAILTATKEGGKKTKNIKRNKVKNFGVVTPISVLVCGDPGHDCPYLTS